MKKKLLALLLVCCVVLGTIPAASAASTGSGTLENGMTWSLSSGTLTISGTGEMMNFERLQDVPWFEYASSITKIMVNPGITTIGDYAFCGCERVTSVSLPDGITSIGYAGFSECVSLTDITLPEGLVSIGEQAFFANDSLTTLELPASVRSLGRFVFSNSDRLTRIVIPEGVTELAESAFSWCTDLTEITLPDSLVSIGDDAFLSCYKLKSITIPSGITAINDGAFCQCFALTEVEIPEGVTSIGYNAFYSCIGLTTVSLPSTLEFIDDQAFSLCSSLTGFQVNENNAVFANDAAGALYSKDFSTLYQVPGVTIRYAVPDTVACIGNGAFRGCMNLVDIKIPDSVTSIGNWAFSNCDHLVSLVIPDSVATLGEYAFAYCDSLVNVTLSANLTALDYRAFRECLALTEIIIPASVTELDSGVFDGCTNLSEVHFLGDAPVFGANHVFGSVTATCYYPSGNPTWNENTLLQYNGNLTWVAEDEAPAPSDPGPDYTITVIPSKGGSASVDVTLAKEGEPVILTVQPDPGYALHQVYTYTDGTYPAQGTKIGDNIYVLYMPDGNVLVDVQFLITDNPFRDVKSTDYFYTPVLWAVTNEITSGVSANRFGPNEGCTRAQVVTFLWRAMNCPEPTSNDNPFRDVKETDYFYKAVLWAKEFGITSGTSETTFSPNAVCTRGQVVSFLWRAMGSPDPTSASHPFRDVKETDYFYKPVLWAVEYGITAGTSPTTFGPSAHCTRGQVVSFLYRTLA